MLTRPPARLSARLLALGLLAPVAPLAPLFVTGTVPQGSAAAAVGPAAAPAAAAPVVRPGEPTLPEPTYGTVSREVMVTMDDGVELAATVAFPSRDGETRLRGKRPVVFGITPYSRNTVCSCYAPEWWAERGFVGASVDTRGTGGSGGNLDDNYFSPREARDGAALVEWFGTRQWSSGRVGMAGGSYVGITQLLTAGRRPEHLAAIAPQVVLSDLYRDAYTHGGVPNLFFDAQYVAVQGIPGAAGTNTDPALLQDSLEAKLGQSPPGTPAFDFLARPEDDSFYRDRSPIEVAHRIEVPVLLIGGWRDGLSQRGAPELFRVLSRRPGVETRMVMDGCTHKGCGAPFATFTDDPAQPDPGAQVFEFMSRHLAGRDTPSRPAVTYHLQGAGRLGHASAWPPARAVERELLLAPDGELLRADRTMLAPSEASYVTNPVAGFSLAFNQYGTVAGSPYVPLDQQLEGPHGLTFRTGELRRGMTLAGPIALQLEARTSAPDTDWHAKLSDVAPDGSETIITEGALRASHRELDAGRSTRLRPYHPHTDPRPVEPGRFLRYAIEIWPTAWRLAPGHRLQLRVTSTDLPTHLPGRFRFDPEDPTGLVVDFNQPATNTLRFGSSVLVLPVLPD